MYRASVLFVLVLSGCAEIGLFPKPNPEPDQITQSAREQKGPSTQANDTGSRTATVTTTQAKTTEGQNAKPVAPTETQQPAESACGATCWTLWLVSAGAAILIAAWIRIKFFTASADEGVPAGESRDEILSREIEALTKLVAAKTREVESLAAKLKDRNDLKILQRIAQLRAGLDFNRAQMASGKLTAEAALREAELELESALSDLGLEIFEIRVGDRVRDLPAGSFEGVRVHEPQSPDQSGTVKHVHQRAVTYRNPEGKTVFLMPAKIDTYKLTAPNA